MKNVIFSILNLFVLKGKKMEVNGIRVLFFFFFFLINKKNYGLVNCMISCARIYTFNYSFSFFFPFLIFVFALLTDLDPLD